MSESDANNLKHIDSTIVRKYKNLQNTILSLVCKNEEPRFNYLMNALRNIIHNTYFENIAEHSDYIKNINTITPDNIEEIKENFKSIEKNINNMKKQFNNLIIKESKDEIKTVQEFESITNKIIYVNIDTDINFKSVFMCLNFLEKDIKDLEKKINENLEYYRGLNLNNTKKKFQYYIISWFVSLFTWTNYDDKIDAYANFKRHCILSLKTYISSFKDIAKSSYKLLNSIKFDDIDIKENDEESKNKLIRRIITCERKITTIKSQLGNS